MRFIAAAILLATGLAGCQTLEQSRQTAQEICSESGLRPGTKAFRACVTSHYRQERRQADAAAGALVVGATAGLVGAALVAEERSARYDRRGYYGGSGYYGTGGYGYGPAHYGSPQPHLRGHRRYADLGGRGRQLRCLGLLAGSPAKAGGRPGNGLMQRPVGPFDRVNRSGLT